MIIYVKLNKNDELLILIRLYHQSIFQNHTLHVHAHVRVQNLKIIIDNDNNHQQILIVHPQEVLNQHPNQLKNPNNIPHHHLYQVEHHPIVIIIDMNKNKVEMNINMDEEDHRIYQIVIRVNIQIKYLIDMNYSMKRLIEI
jgi:hypothetical protein